jgi:hypothetical protein
MPAPEQRVVNCPCGTRLLLRWTWSIGSAIYPVRCPDCDAEHQLHATSPIEVYRHDSKGNREYVTRSVERRPFKISNRCSSRITCSTVGSVFKTFCLGLFVQRGWHTLRMRQRGVLRAIFKGRPFPRRYQSIY